MNADTFARYCRLRPTIHNRPASFSTWGAASINSPAPSASTAIRSTRADVLADLDRFPYPFRDAAFGQIRAIHVIEHVQDVIRTMEEFHRLARPGGARLSLNAALHRFQLLLRPHPPLAPEQLLVPLFRRRQRRLRLLFDRAIP